MTIHWPHHIRIALMLLASVILASGRPAWAQSGVPLRTNYLQGAALGYTPPLVVSLTDGQRALEAVKSAQRQADEDRRREAYVDAGSYGYDVLLPRFSEAAGTDLNLGTRPILAHMLKWLLSDTDGYINSFKFPGTVANKRARPYKEDPSILPCETDFLYGSADASYPSGHAAHGNAAALLIAAVMTPGPPDPAYPKPDRRALIAARGIRFGQNRVVCGVHHPTDIVEGRAVAQHVFDKASADPVFQADLACAKEENEQSPANRLHGRTAYSPDCQARFAQYAVEAAGQLALEREQASPFNPQ